MMTNAGTDNTAANSDNRDQRGLGGRTGGRSGSSSDGISGVLMAKKLIPEFVDWRHLVMDALGLMPLRDGSQLEEFTFSRAGGDCKVFVAVGRWCNGSTGVFEALSHGSNPCRPTNSSLANSSLANSPLNHSSVLPAALSCRIDR